MVIKYTIRIQLNKYPKIPKSKTRQRIEGGNIQGRMEQNISPNAGRLATGGINCDSVKTSYLRAKLA